VIDVTQLRSYDDLQQLLDRFGVTRADVQPGAALTQMTTALGPWTD
jgi:hypothetical protein